MRSLLFLSSAFPGPSPASSAPTDVADRSTAFQPVEGGTEHRSGETLLVAAYAGLWVLLMGWVLMQWTKQTALARRVQELEAAVAGAVRAEAEGKPSKLASPATSSAPKVHATDA